MGRRGGAHASEKAKSASQRRCLAIRKARQAAHRLNHIQNRDDDEAGAVNCRVRTRWTCMPGRGIASGMAVIQCTWSPCMPRVSKARKKRVVIPPGFGHAYVVSQFIGLVVDRIVASVCAAIRALSITQSRASTHSYRRNTRCLSCNTKDRAILWWTISRCSSSPESYSSFISGNPSG